MKKTRSLFTLIELLVVIAIIGILASILFPVLGNVQQHGKISDAKVLVASVNSAITNYLSVYDRLPDPQMRIEGTARIGFAGNKVADYLNEDKDFLEFGDILTYSDHTNASNQPLSTVKNMNPEGQQFLTASQAYFEKGEGKGGLRDRWGNHLLVVLDSDGDGKCEFDSGNLTQTGTGTIMNGNSIVISLGWQEATTVDSRLLVYSNK